MKTDGKIAILFENTFRIFEDFDEADRLRLYDAYFRYFFDDVEPQDLSREARRVWLALLPTMNHRKVKQRAGKAGGRASGESRREAKAKQNQSKTEAEPKQNPSKNEANAKLSTKYKVQSTNEKVQSDTVSVTDSVSENSKVSEGISSLSMSTGKARSTRTRKKTTSTLKDLYPNAMEVWEAVRAVYPANRRHAPSEGLLQVIEAKNLIARKDELVQTTELFAKTDDEWRRGYAPAMRRYFEEERYENPPTPPKPPEVREVLTVRSSTPSVTTSTGNTDLPQF